MTLLIRIALVAISAALYFGLAVLGFGGAGAFFANPARIALTIVGAALFAASFFAGGNISPGEREDRGNRWVIAAFTIVSLLLAYAPAWCDRHDVLTLDGDAARWAGVALFAVGGGLRLAPVFVLGRRFSGLVAIQQDHRLVTSGVYRVIRHPSYVGLIVSSFGWALAFRSIIGLLLAALLIPVLIARIRAEEALLLSHFGAEYAAYRARTWRMIPGIY
ncbi:MAG TPA: isoprenylcysteine carboxylmethyltransferase family protein [Roseiarcus sp.]|nr:isoprenylcysteine carboxylmethyltransferase family protein [Roseiarcus sp.]